MKKSFILYSDQLAIFEKLSPPQTKDLILKIFAYSNGNWAGVPIDDLVVDMAFTAIKLALDRDMETYNNICERNRINGLQGGRPPKPKKPSGLSGNPKNPREPKKADSDSDSDSDIKKKNIKKKKTFVPPSENDVVSYFKEKGFSAQAGKKAFEYYNEAAWKDARGNPVKNWKQKMIAVWFKDENKETAISDFKEYVPPWEIDQTPRYNPKTDKEEII